MAPNSVLSGARRMAVGASHCTPRCEHSVPWFWPMAAMIEMGQEGLTLFQENAKFIERSLELTHPPAPDWATRNRVLADFPTMRLRDFSATDAPADAVPVLVDAPYAGHSSTIADYAPGQSLVETLRAAGLTRVYVTDWKSATPEMRDFDIDTYLGDLHRAVQAIGGRAHLVGLCQGGWMSAMYACLHPDRVATLVLAGSPIDTDAGEGPIRTLAHATPLSVYDEMVAAGGGLMRGQFMLAGWKSMHPGTQFLGKWVDLYEHIEDRNYIARTERFERWYENPLDLPGVYYLQAIKLLFKENQFAKGHFVARGQRLTLRSITCPLYLLAGEQDDITTPEQVFAAEHLVSTPAARITRKSVPGGHIGLFMGTRTLAETWPGIGRWIAAGGKDAP